MKATVTPSKNPRDTTPIILRLERNNTELLSLKDKLSSYVCEPKTLNLFERMESLKAKLEKMRKANLETNKSVKRTQKIFRDP